MVGVATDRNARYLWPAPMQITLQKRENEKETRAIKKRQEKTETWNETHEKKGKHVKNKPKWKHIKNIFQKKKKNNQQKQIIIFWEKSKNIKKNEKHQKNQK